MASAPGLLVGSVEVRITQESVGSACEADNWEMGDGKESGSHTRLAPGESQSTTVRNIQMLRNGELWG